MGVWGRCPQRVQGQSPPEAEGILLPKRANLSLSFEWNLNFAAICRKGPERRSGDQKNRNGVPVRSGSKRTLIKYWAFPVTSSTNSVQVSRTCYLRRSSLVCLSRHCVQQNFSQTEQRPIFTRATYDSAGTSCGPVSVSVSVCRSWSSSKTAGRIELVFGMEASFDLSYSDHEIQVTFLWNFILISSRQVGRRNALST